MVSFLVRLELGVRPCFSVPLKNSVPLRLFNGPEDAWQRLNSTGTSFSHGLFNRGGFVLQLLLPILHHVVDFGRTGDLSGRLKHLVSRLKWSEASATTWRALLPWLIISMGVTQELFLVLIIIILDMSKLVLKISQLLSILVYTI